MNHKKSGNPEIRESRMDENPEWAKYFLGVKIQDFSSASNRVFSLSEPKTGPPRQGSLEKVAFSGCRRATTSREIGMSARILVIWCLICHLNRKPRRLTRRSRATFPQSCSAPIGPTPVDNTKFTLTGLWFAPTSTCFSLLARTFNVPFLLPRRVFLKITIALTH